MSHARVENRAHLIYEHLVLRMGKGVTMPDLCNALDIEPGDTTQRAVRRARELATEAGYHFPPAVAQNGFRYMVTDMPGDALDPALTMARVESGVRRRKEDGIEFMRRERAKLPADLRPVVDMHLTIYDAAKKALSQIQQAADDMVLKLVKARKENRDQ